MEEHRRAYFGRAGLLIVVYCLYLAQQPDVPMSLRFLMLAVSVVGAVLFYIFGI